MRTIIYPGTFDPVTLGHINLIERASRLFDKVIIAIAYSERKSPLFTFDERVDLCLQSLKHLNNIEVVGFKGLIVDLAREHDACGVLRGVRNATDFDYELQMADMNQHMKPDFETLFLTPANAYSFISSTLVREIASMGGETCDFVSPVVQSALDSKFKK
ncbi:MAG: pantetheine-phosphate adenylyltransferase [Sinobacterium sp.]|nr:pantetheine-phosphate adenylyltransferase [Sinobacterium sp.]